ncbi:MAG: nucleotidyltransferase family protein [Candidatus Acidiferrales bacterium]
MKRKTAIVPIILAAGPEIRGPRRSAATELLKPLARFGRKTALEIAVENCAGLARPVVVLGYQAARVRPAVPRGAAVVVNRRWRAGQLGSLLAGLRRVPPGAAFVLYPVDYPLLTRADIQRLAKAFRARRAGMEIVAPVFRGRSGHPVLFSPALRAELEKARTAKEVVLRDRRRLRLAPAGTSAIWLDFRTPAAYRRRLRTFLSR